MRPWFLMLAGLATWAVHFTGVYIVVSLEDLNWPERAAQWRLVAALFTALCAAVCVGVLILAWRYIAGLPSGPRRFMGKLGAVGAGLALVGVIWQGLAVLI